MLQFIHNLIRCRYGFFLWHYLTKKHLISPNSAVILFPDCRDRDNYYGMLYMDQYLRQNNRESALVLTRDIRVPKSIGDFSEHIIKTIYISRAKADALIQYALLYDFDDRFVIAALDIPAGRNGSRLVNLKGLTEEEVFAVGVYKLHPFCKERKKRWEGSIFEYV